MYSTANRTRIVGLAVTTAMAAALLSGCATMAPHVAKSQSKPKHPTTEPVAANAMSLLSP